MWPSGIFCQPSKKGWMFCPATRLNSDSSGRTSGIPCPRSRNTDAPHSASAAIRAGLRACSCSICRLMVIVAVFALAGSAEPLGLFPPLRHHLLVFVVRQIIPAQPGEAHVVDRALPERDRVGRIRVVLVTGGVIEPRSHVQYRARRHDRLFVFVI